MNGTQPSLLARCFAEFLGTFILILFGCGAVHAAVLTGAQSGLWQVAIVWGVAIMLAIYTIGAVSGAHINPAITITFAFWNRFSWSLVVPYILSQLIGAFAAAAVLFAMFHPFLAEKERKAGVVRGQPGSEITAMCYGEYFPSPDGNFSEVVKREPNAMVPEWVAFGAEVLGTLLLALVVFAVTDDRNPAGPRAQLAPVFIGLTVAALISVIAPLTQACFNPARDFGPRLFAFLAGWGTIALPGPRTSGFLVVYIVAPIVGAILGGGVYLKLIRPALLAQVPPAAEQSQIPART